VTRRTISTMQQLLSSEFRHVLRHPKVHYLVQGRLLLNPP
jgi:hypothetical protein